MQTLQSPAHIARYIHQHCMPVNGPLLVNVTYTDGTVHQGCFLAFEDYHLLKPKLQFRFIPFDRLKQFHAIFKATHRMDNSISIVIDCHLVEQVSVVST